MKIICVGWNYSAHNRELQAVERPENPTVFMKPDSALLKDGKPFFVPDFSSQVEHEVELVVKINRLGKNIAPRFAHRYYEEVTLGVDFTARDLQKQLRQQGAPWEISKSFDGSAVIGEFVAVSELPSIQALSFQLEINGETRQQGFTGDMLFTVDEIVAYVSRFFTLKIGDLIFTGTPMGVGRVHEEDHLTGLLEGRKILDFYVR